MKERIPIEKAVLMVGTAALFDFIGLIPLVNIATSMANLLLFPFWFYLSGASYTKKPSMLWWTLITSAIGLIPVVSTFLPELTLGVLRNVLYVRREDRRANTAEQRVSTSGLNQRPYPRNNPSGAVPYTSNPLPSLPQQGPSKADAVLRKGRTTQSTRNVIDDIRRPGQIIKE